MGSSGGLAVEPSRHHSSSGQRDSISGPVRGAAARSCSSRSHPVINPDLLAILACPESRQVLKLADEATLGRVNSAIETGELKNVGGTEVTKPLEAGLVREDGEIIYPVRDDIPVLLVDEGIPLKNA